MLLISARTFAQKDHAHASPHGGVVKTAGDYHIEMVMAGDKISFYVLDANEKTLSNKGVTGNVVLQFEDKTTSTEKLTAEGTEQWKVVPKKKDVMNCIVTFNVNGKSITAKFPHHGKDEKHEGHDGHSDSHKH